MDKSTANPKNLISPEAARSMWADLYPDPPGTGTALLARSKRGQGPPYHLVPGQGTGRRMYDPAEVRAWLLERQPPTVREALAVLALVEANAPHGSPVMFLRCESDSWEVRVDHSDHTFDFGEGVTLAEAVRDVEARMEAGNAEQVPAVDL